MSNISEKEINDIFLTEVGEYTDQAELCLLTLEKNISDKEAMDTLFRALHNMKGGAKSFGFNELATFSHEIENLLVAIKAGTVNLTKSIYELLFICVDRLRKDISILKNDHDARLVHQELLDQLTCASESIAPVKNNEDIDLGNNKIIAATEKENPKKIEDAQSVKQNQEYVRISQNKIDDLLNNFGEQVILQATLEHIKYDLLHNNDIAIKTINQLSKLTYDLQQTTIALRMVNLKQLFSKLERTARDTAAATAKTVEFVAEGQHNEIDKTIADAIGDPLNHMIRNAVDHGIETPDLRKKNGKAEAGKITISAHRRGGFFNIIVEDDGAGLDKEKIYSNAVKKGHIKADAVLTDSEIYNLIYINGLSTRDAANDISGRGVGMDVVNESIRALKGTCEISARVGFGTRFTIRLPLSLAIFNGMVVRVSENIYIIPNADIERVLHVAANSGRAISGSNDRVIEVAGTVIPLIDLREKFKNNTRHKTQGIIAEGTMIITQTAARRHAVIVDEVISQQRIVHKPLGREVSQLKGITGATILGDGKAALILDISAWLSSNVNAA